VRGAVVVPVAEAVAVDMGWGLRNGENTFPVLVMRSVPAGWVR
jgi:hypothetical protein